MSKNPESPEIGEVFQEPYECETITWEIPNISILHIAQDTEVQSPWFYYKKAVWVLKMCPFVRNCIEVRIERLHSKIPEHEFLYTIFFKNHKYLSDGNYYSRLNFNFYNKQSQMFFADLTITNWYSLFYHSSGLRCNDTITLIVKILIKKDAVVGLDFETKSPETGLGEYQL